MKISSRPSRPGKSPTAPNQRIPPDNRRGAKSPSSPFSRIQHEVDFCVVGGGMAGICAAISAARHGARVVLMHERPVLGGNASSECRVHICGADRHNGFPNLRETGLLEEIRLDNLYHNPDKNYSIWDLLLHDKARFEPNLTLLLNCTCLDAEMDGSHIRSVTGWQLTTQTCHEVRAKIFADCSGDAILAPITGAAFRVGREARHEFNESIAPERADSRTMGMTCLFQSREHDHPRLFKPPSWAERYERCEDLPYGPTGHQWWQMGYWWVELGGEHDSVRDTERLRDDLLRITLGVWDHIKNRCPHCRDAANWALEWIQFLPGKRESRRYIGDHVLCQGDIESGGRFDDEVAYGGWSMDDHHPAGFRAVRIGAPATIFHEAPSPYGLPYRMLYSRNIANLMFAGRDASCTHAAMSSTRMMGTGCVMGQAVGAAAAIAVREGLDPCGVARHLHELQQTLLADDAHLPNVRQEFPDLTIRSRLEASQGDPSPVRDGINRPVGDNPHAWTGQKGAHVAYQFCARQTVREVSLILDSGLDQLIFMSYHQRDAQLRSLPGTLPKTFRLDGLEHGSWRMITRVEDNHRRLVRVPINRELEGVRLVLEDTWAAEKSRVYAFWVS
jgi:hypothetical protein